MKQTMRGFLVSVAAVLLSIGTVSDDLCGL